jgi:hypothetical protein
MQLDLTYQVSLERLAKLSRSAFRKTFPKIWLLQWLLCWGLLAVSLASFEYSDELDLWMQTAGMPLVLRLGLPWLPLASFVAIFILLHRLKVELSRSLLDFDPTIRLTKDDSGIRLTTEGVDIYVKWRGISQMLMERDGVAVLCAHTLFLVPDAAFPDAGTRLAFITDVYGHLTEKARSVSEKYIRPVLDSGS